MSVHRPDLGYTKVSRAIHDLQDQGRQELTLREITEQARSERRKKMIGVVDLMRHRGGSAVPGLRTLMDRTKLEIESREAAKVKGVIDEMARNNRGLIEVRPSETRPEHMIRDPLDDGLVYIPKIKSNTRLP